MDVVISMPVRVRIHTSMLGLVWSQMFPGNPGGNCCAQAGAAVVHSLWTAASRATASSVARRRLRVSADIHGSSRAAGLACASA